MATEVSPEPTASATDQFLYSWVRWREECETVHSAYRYWATCDEERREFAFGLYVAALDREEQAARIHEHRSMALAEAA